MTGATNTTTSTHTATTIYILQQQQQQVQVVRSIYKSILMFCVMFIRPLCPSLYGIVVVIVWFY